MARMQDAVKSGSQEILLVLMRISLAWLILFEILNGVGVLHFTLDYSWFGLICTSIFGLVAAELLVWFQKNINPLLIMSPVVAAVFLDAFGDMQHLYTLVSHYDKALHFLNSGVITYLAFAFLRGSIDVEKFWPRLLALFAATIGIALGTLYEIEEFLEDQLINHRQLRFGDSFDTGGDLLMDVLGCTTVAVMVYFWGTKARTAKQTACMEVFPENETKM